MRIGTALEKIFKYTGVKWLVKKIWGENCGCEERRDKLDKLTIRRNE